MNIENCIFVIHNLIHRIMVTISFLTNRRLHANYFAKVRGGELRGGELRRGELRGGE